MANLNYMELFNKAGEAALETVKQIAEINAKAGEKLLEQQMQLANSMIDAASRSADLVSKAKGVQEVVTGQAQIAQESTQQLIASFKRTAEIVTEAGKAVVATTDQAARDARENLAQAAA